MVFCFRTSILLSFLAAAMFATSALAMDFTDPASTAPTSFQLTKIDGPDPSYPRRAMANGQNGWVELRFTVTPDGLVETVRVVDAEPRRVFERAALRAAAKWVFKAPSDAGISDTVTGVYRVKFVTK